MKICVVCKIEKPYDCFHKAGKGKLDGRCKTCKSEIAKQNRSEDYFKQYCSTKKSECKKKGYEFDLTKEFLEEIWTGKCPIFGTDLFRAAEGKGSHQSAHLDRLDSSKGYTIGNVAWISGRANRIKYDASIDELRKIADWMEGATTIETTS